MEKREERRVKNWGVGGLEAIGWTRGVWIGVLMVVRTSSFERWGAIAVVIFGFRNCLW